METKEIKNETPVEKILNTKSVSRAQKLMESRRGLWLVGMISFLESALPIPLVTDPFLAAGIALNRSKALTLTLITTVSSVAGGTAAFLMAVFFYESILNWLSAEVALSLATMTVNEDQGTFILTIIGAFTPVPYTFSAWAVAVSGGNILIFIIASALGRGVRYSIIAWIVYRFGPLALRYAKQSIRLTSLALFIFIALYWWLKM